MGRHRGSRQRADAPGVDLGKGVAGVVDCPVAERGSGDCNSWGVRAVFEEKVRMDTCVALAVCLAVQRCHPVPDAESEAVKHCKQATARS